MILKKIIVKNLFDAFDHQINLNEGVTIMIGENGYGKTTILKMLKAVMEKEFTFFCSIVFEKFVLVFDNQSIEIEKKENDVYLNGNKIVDGKKYEEEILITIKNTNAKIEINEQTSLQELIKNNVISGASRFERNFNNRIKRSIKLEIPTKLLLIGTERLNRGYAPLQYMQNFTKEKLYLQEDKVHLFVETINSYFLNKKFLIEKDKLAIYSTITQKQIPVMALSSGEQHLLVLFYLLLFKVNKNTFVLFDEPETSLHIHWQQRFIDDLQRIIAFQKNMTILVATHSPNLIDHHWNLTVELSEATKP